MNKLVEIAPEPSLIILVIPAFNGGEVSVDDEFVDYYIIPSVSLRPGTSCRENFLGLSFALKRTPVFSSINEESVCF